MKKSAPSSKKNTRNLTGGEISIGLLGDHYRVVVEDASHILHTIHIHPHTYRSTAIGSNRKIAGLGRKPSVAVLRLGSRP
jgi:hypothetical protein